MRNFLVSSSALVAVALLAVSCGSEGGSAKQDPEPVSYGYEGHKIVLDHNYRDAYEFKLSDGTVCVATGTDGGLSHVICNWLPK